MLTGIFLLISTSMSVVRDCAEIRWGSAEQAAFHKGPSPAVRFGARFPIIGGEVLDVVRMVIVARVDFK
jgi:hypothetical protein